MNALISLMARLRAALAGMAANISGRCAAWLGRKVNGMPAGRRKVVLAGLALIAALYFLSVAVRPFIAPERSAGPAPRQTAIPFVPESGPGGSDVRSDLLELQALVDSSRRDPQAWDSLLVRRPGLRDSLLELGIRIK